MVQTVANAMQINNFNSEISLLFVGMCWFEIVSLIVTLHGLIVSMLWVESDKSTWLSFISSKGSATIKESHKQNEDSFRKLRMIEAAQGSTDIFVKKCEISQLPKKVHLETNLTNLINGMQRWENPNQPIRFIAL